MFKCGCNLRGATTINKRQTKGRNVYAGNSTGEYHSGAKIFGLSQRELAKKAGVSQSRVQRIEREGVIDAVTYMEVVAITTALDLSIHAVMDRSFAIRVNS